MHIFFGSARRGVVPNSIEARAYRKLLELEEAILLWEGENSYPTFNNE